MNLEPTAEQIAKLKAQYPHGRASNNDLERSILRENIIEALREMDEDKLSGGEQTLRQILQAAFQGGIL